MKCVYLRWLSMIVALACSTAVVSANDSPVNVVLIVADDLGYGELGCYGGRGVPTPHIDSLADDGVRMTNGYVSCPVCSPTRAGLLTGRYQQRFGHEFNPDRHAKRVTGPLAKTERTLAELLQAAGYKTGMVGKWHLGYLPGASPSIEAFRSTLGFLPCSRLSGQRSPPERGSDPARSRDDRPS